VANTTTTMKMVANVYLHGQTTRIRVRMSFILVLERATMLIVLRARVAITHLFRFPWCCRSRWRRSRDAQGDCRGGIGVLRYRGIISL
jgi:hypothetical protein